MKAIQDAFPQAKIVNATEMMQEIRAVKSAEEVSMLERSAAIVEKTIEAMVENANPGVSEKELYGAMVHAMLANGGELPTLFFLSAGPGHQQQLVCADRLSHSKRRPADRRDRSEIRRLRRPSRVSGGARTAGRRISKDDRYLSRLLRRNSRRMKPGVTFGCAVRRLHANRRASRARENILWNHPMMHARGLGDDGPALLGDKDLERFSKIELKPA